jgi:uncharacterized protein (TIGR00251 family)
MDPCWRANAGGVSLSVKVQPGARRDALIGRVPDTAGQRLKICVMAPPEDGRANDAVCALVAAALGLPRRNVQVAQGAASRQKLLHIAGDPDTLIERLSTL